MRSACLSCPGLDSIAGKGCPKSAGRRPRSDLRIDRTEVLVPVAVNDTYNRPVSGLEKENFRVFDDKVEQVITSFSMEDEPVAVGLVFDTSGSMTGTEREERMAATGVFQDRESRR